MNKESILKGLIESGNPIRLIGENSDNFLVKNFTDNQICKLWYASALKNIAIYPLLETGSSELQEKFVKYFIDNAEEVSSCTFKEYFDSLPLQKQKPYDYMMTNYIFNTLNACMDFSEFNSPYWQSTLQDCIKDLLDGKIAILNLSFTFAFLIYHSKEEQIYFVHFDNARNFLICDVLFNKRDINDNNFSWILGSSKFLNKNKKIVTIYPSFERYFGGSTKFKSLYNKIANTPDKINQNELIDHSVNSKEKWKEFKNTGLLWFINTILHLFGYAIKYKVDKETGELLDVFPDRCNYRGFSQESNAKGYINVSKYMKEHAEELLKEAKED